MPHSRGPSTNRLAYARQCVVTTFANHWRRILRSRKDIAKERAVCFFAGITATQLRLARSFYGREHAQRMASLSATEISETLAPWLEHALRYWHDWEMEDNFLAEIASAEYVSIVDSHHSRGTHIPGIPDGPMVDRYPGNGDVAYDDLYERLLSGCSCGGVLRIYKSTGECFTPFEARSARAGIRRDLLDGIASDADDDPWVFDMNAEWSWETAAFAGEDFERVIVVEVNDYAGQSDD